MELITIVPGPGQMKFIAQDLLFVADHPSDVVYVSRPQPGFQVSEELFDRFVAFQEDILVKVDEQVKSVAETVTPIITEVPATAKRGRPKKNVGAN